MLRTGFSNRNFCVPFAQFETRWVFDVNGKQPKSQWLKVTYISITNIITIHTNQNPLQLNPLGTNVSNLYIQKASLCVGLSTLATVCRPININNIINSNITQTFLLYTNRPSSPFHVFYWWRACHVRLTELDCLLASAREGDNALFTEKMFEI